MQQREDQVYNPNQENRCQYKTYCLHRPIRETQLRQDQNQQREQHPENDQPDQELKENAFHHWLGWRQPRPPIKRTAAATASARQLVAAPGKVPTHAKDGRSGHCQQ
jgi:hypothetical protein